MAERIFTPRGRIFNLGVFALVLEAVSAVALLATSSYLISRAAEQPPIMYLMMAVVGVRAFALGRASFRYLQRLGLHDAVFAKLADLRPRIFIKLSKQTETESADSLEKVTTDLDAVQDWTLRVLGPVIQSAQGHFWKYSLAGQTTGLSAKASSAVAVTWADGSLGCPEPGMNYTMALVPGYRIKVQAGERQLDYHASRRGYFVLCPDVRSVDPLPDSAI